MKLLSLTLLALVALTLASDHWNSGLWTELDGKFCEECPLGMSLVRVDSFHGKPFDSYDRGFWFECRKLTDFNGDNCTWSDGFVNDVNEDFDYQCEAEGAIAGFRSGYNETADDRRWEIKCCNGGKSPDIDFNCWYNYNDTEHSPYTNEVNQDFTFHSGHDNYISGIKSLWHEESKDRRFAFYYCKRI